MPEISEQTLRVLLQETRESAHRMDRDEIDDTRRDTLRDAILEAEAASQAEEQV